MRRCRISHLSSIGQSFRLQIHTKSGLHIIYPAQKPQLHSSHIYHFSRNRISPGHNQNTAGPQLGDLYVHDNFYIENSLDGPLLVGTAYIDKFAKGMFSMDRLIIPKRSRVVAISAEYEPPSDLFAALHTDTNAENSREDQHDKRNRIKLFASRRVSWFREIRKYLYQSWPAASY